MSFIFGNVGSVYSILDDVNEEEEGFSIEEIRYCNCFFDEFQYFIRKNNFKIGFNEVYNEFFYIPKNFRMELFLLYYSKLSIFCCEVCVNFYYKLGYINKYEMDKNQVCKKVEYCCLYYRFKLLNEESIFNCICRNCQITLLKLVSKKLNSFKLTKK